jgi:ATP phosphoribosyltransferase regulatory subunit
MVLGGGRYDNLLAEFGRDAAAVGFAVALDPLAEALLEAGNCGRAAPTQVLVFAEDGREAQAISKAAQLRQEGKVCLIATCSTAEEASNFAKEKEIGEVVVV